MKKIMIIKRRPANSNVGLALGVTFLLIFMFGLKTNANATSQWAKKFKTSCVTCHNAFPRLNHYGERFMLNGYQDPDADSPDGSVLAKRKINDNLSLGNLSNFLGVRLNLTPVQIKTDKLVVNGEKQTETTFGNPNWFQLFFAGSISKNVSIFIEAEADGSEFHFSWYHIGFHNLGNTTLANAFIGNISPLDFASYANRLRQIGAIKGDIFGIKSSGGATDNKPEDALNVSGSRPGVMYFGYKGPFVLWAGLSPGSSAKDVNNKIHGWTGLKLQVPESAESMFEGSSVTAWIYKGEDAANTATAQITNPYTRLSFQGDLRWNDFDVQAAYVTVTEDNYYLDTSNREEKYSGISVVAGKNIVKWYPALQFDTIRYDDDALALQNDRTKLTTSLSYFLRENIRLGFHTRFDVSDENGGSYQRSHDSQLNIRIMF